MRAFYFSAQGRISRARFWLGHLAIAALVLAGLIVAAILVAIAQAVDGGKSLAVDIPCYVLALIVMLATYGAGLWSSICLGIRRYHDRGKPGVWVLIQFVPIIGAIWYFVESFCLAGTYGANQYGEDPLNPDVGSVAVAVEAAKIAARSPVSNGRPGWVVPVLLTPAAIGLCLVVAGVVLAGRTQSWLAAAEKVDGKIVALQPTGKTSDDGHEMYRSVVEAQARAGGPIRITDIWATYPAPEIGTSVTLAYPPGKPAEAIVVGFLNLYFVPTMLASFGVAGMVFWLFVVLLVKVLWKRELPTPGDTRPRRETSV